MHIAFSAAFVLVALLFLFGAYTVLGESLLDRSVRRPTTHLFVCVTLAVLMLWCAYVHIKRVKIPCSERPVVDMRAASRKAALIAALLAAGLISLAVMRAQGVGLLGSYVGIELMGFFAACMLLWAQSAFKPRSEGVGLWRRLIR